MPEKPKIRTARRTDASSINALLSEWFDWSPESGRLHSIKRPIGNGEIAVAEVDATVIGFIHYVMHEDIIDGGPNSFISAFYVSQNYRGKGVGSLMLDHAIKDAISRGAVGVETSTIHHRAEKLYKEHHFSQTIGDIPEVFLELDIPEYLRAVKGSKR